MNLYFAPMEGLTEYIYRNAHNAFFNNIDKYFSPFISANRSKSFTNRELNDVFPANNQGIVLIPQILSNNAEEFIHTAKKLSNMGYNEINLNLGCPSKIVVSKNRGSGFLSKTEELDAFLDEIFSKAVTKVSVKTRIGKDNPEEFYNLIEIYNKYPMEELIIHPRTQKDMYNNKPNLKVFADALKLSKNSICYNGDIFTVQDYKEFSVNFPDVNTLMLGRGLLTNPGLSSDIIDNIRLEKNILKEFHDKIYEDYRKILPEDKYLLSKMKGLWFYMIKMFPGNKNYKEKIMRSQTLCDYDEAVSIIFNEQTVLENSIGYSECKTI